MEQSSLVPSSRTVLADVGRRPSGSFPEHVAHDPGVAALPVPAGDDLRAGGRPEDGRLTAGLPPAPWTVARPSPTPAP